MRVWESLKYVGLDSGSANSWLTCGTGVVSLPLRLLLAGFEEGIDNSSSCFEGGLWGSGVGLSRPSSGCASVRVSRRSHQNLISSLVPSFHRRPAPTSHRLDPLSLWGSLCYPPLPPLDVGHSDWPSEACVCVCGLRAYAGGLEGGVVGCHGAGCDIRPPPYMSLFVLHTHLHSCPLEEVVLYTHCICNARGK